MSEKKIEIDATTLSVLEKAITAGVNEGIQKGMKEYDFKQKNKMKIKYDKDRKSVV